jgi:hypothetical protein
MEVRGQPYVPPALRHTFNSSTHCRRGWEDTRATLDGSGKDKVSFPFQDSNPAPSRQQQAATPNELHRLLKIIKCFLFI